MGVNIQLLKKIERLRKEDKNVIRKKIKDNEFYKILINADIITKPFDLSKTDLNSIKLPIKNYSIRFDDASSDDVSINDHYYAYKDDKSLDNFSKRFSYIVTLNTIVTPDCGRTSRVVVMDLKTADIIAQLELTPYKKKYTVNYKGFNPYKNQPEKSYAAKVDVVEKLISPFPFTGYDWKWKWSNFKYSNGIDKLEGESLFEESCYEMSMMFAHKFEQYKFKVIQNDTTNNIDSSVPEIDSQKDI